ncbi:replication protein P [Enterobacter hormaechei]|uniref:replication protein P n=1 Tax=Enterobacter hormaechei TaxID=158836 RepID=UPI0012590132|nr:replication protein P [Enterobacter hormaechei]HAS0717044.1 phage replication protein [Enterobacter hormaechei subsp. steigerwaltii]HCJ7631179.1 phage replication protein [Enterobacter hormaechei subsp. xiangfangensis]HED1502383.1 phage replication protein [Enterobacter hormaechei subsp. hoffmannii]EKS6407726.1 phage replication protein [Enterobacter hormaechei]MDS1986409.1 replication protein P [Enterobacter hormaechei]
MKNIAESIRNFDREQARRVAHNLPEQYTDRDQTQQVAQIINGLFVQLAAAFPASLVNRSQEDMNEIRRQWVLAFKENGITTLEQVEAGMRMVRRQDRPFLPSPGQFIKWCREGRCVLGITTADVMAEYWKWRKLVFRYPSSEQYPWPTPVYYHICLELRRRGTDGQLSLKELEREAGDILGKWEKRVIEGKPVPPVRRAIAAPVAEQGPMPIQLLLAKYNRNKSKGMV